MNHPSGGVLGVSLRSDDEDGHVHTWQKRNLVWP
jgi:hypothetical protein